MQQMPALSAAEAQSIRPYCRHAVSH